MAYRWAYVTYDSGQWLFAKDNWHKNGTPGGFLFRIENENASFQYESIAAELRVFDCTIFFVPTLGKREQF